MVDSRSARQEAGIQKWLDSKCSSVLEWATGMGKSFTAITIIKRMQAKKQGATAFIVVPTLYLQAQFWQAVRRAGLQNVDVWVINSFVREKRHADLLIMDEIHLFLGEHSKEFSKVFQMCSSPWRLGLSATLTAEEKERLSSLSLPVVDTITMQEATAAGWIARNKTYNLGVELTFAEKQEYDKWNDIHNSKFAFFGHDFAVAMSCITSKDARERFSRQMGWHEGHGKQDRWSPQSIGAAANMWRLASQKRQDIVHHAAAKYQTTVYLLGKFEVRAICFSESTRFASELAGYLPEIARPYHTNLESIDRPVTITKTFKNKPDETTTVVKRIGKATLLREAIEAFNDDASPVRVLSTAKALDQGADFAHLKLGIETSGSGTIRQKVQRTGRVVRKDASIPIEDQMAVYVHIYALGTHEAGKLRRKQKGIVGIKEVKHVDEITF